MPLLSRLLARAALLYLALGFTLGGLMLWDKGVPLVPGMLRLLPLHIESVLFGWTVQLAMSVSFWILPKFEGGATRGNEGAVWASFWLLNAGVWLAGGAPLVGLPPELTLLGRICEVAAAALYVSHAWKRVKPMLGGKSG